MTCIVKKDLPFAKVGEEVEVKDSMFSSVEGVEIWKQNGRITLWPSQWGDPIADGWLAEKKPSRWFPEDGDWYWFVNSMLTVGTQKFNPKHNDDTARCDAGNCFKIEHAAHELALRLRNCAQSYNMELEAAIVGRKADFSHINGTSMCDVSDCTECAKRGAVECACDGKAGSKSGVMHGQTNCLDMDTGHFFSKSKI